MPTMTDEPTVFRPNSVSYLRIPAPEPAKAAAFYEAVFDWEVDPEAAGSRTARAT
jgi:predicted enzyme related to lactoylglutathione lyase